MKDLTIAEETVLIAILRLKDDAYGVTIRKKIEGLTKKKVIYGTLYNTLDQLVKKRYVSRTKGDPVPERGGRSKIYYTVTPDGLKALQATRELHNSLWDGLPDYLISKG